LKRNIGSSDQFHRLRGQTLVSMTELYSQYTAYAQAGQETQTIYVTQHEYYEEPFGPAIVRVNTKSLSDSGYEVLLRHITENLEPDIQPLWEDMAEESPDLATFWDRAEMF
jgi:hypothetical protein